MRRKTLCEIRENRRTFQRYNVERAASLIKKERAAKEMRREKYLAQLQAIYERRNGK